MKKSIVILLHFGYWSVFLLIMTILLLGFQQGITAKQIGEALLWSPFSLGALLPSLIGFYSFYFIVFNKYLSHKKIWGVLLSTTLLSFVSSIISEIALYSAFSGDLDHSFNTIFFSGLFLCFVSFVNGVIALVMRGFITWFGEIRLKAELNKKNYEMELALIKAQINPHFLFNTINNIDMLIKIDSIKASEYLNKLSDIMRFMLYEAKSEKISLSKELSYVEKYVELQKIRTTNPNYIRYEVIGNPSGLLIEPMLFIPFIENAFKHAENKKTDGAIVISFVIEDSKIMFTCKNAYSESTQLKPEYGGLGNELISRRLNLLYPGLYQLETGNKNGVYTILLSVSLEK